MGYLGRRIGKAQNQGDSNPGGDNGAVGGGILDLFANGYFERQGDIYNAPGIGPTPGMDATGGVVRDFTSGSNAYRAHIFTTSGTFTVNDLARRTRSNRILSCCGGGGSGEGGGGAGGLRTNLTGHPLAAPSYTVTETSYTVTVGGGGLGGRQNSANRGPGAAGTPGGNSEFYPTPQSYPSVNRIRAVGGGGGAGYNNAPGFVGGSGGGGCSGPTSGAKSGKAGNSPTDPNHPKVQGYAGADGASYGGGGGGATAAGSSDDGGAGSQVIIADNPTTPAPTMLLVLMDHTSLVVAEGAVLLVDLVELVVVQTE